MTQEHPITPPPELVREWSQNRGYSCADELWDYLATQAARWGADQELEACCQEVQDWYGNGSRLRAIRRPKPPSLKERLSKAIIDGDERKALKLLEELDDSL